MHEHQAAEELQRTAGEIYTNSVTSLFYQANLLQQSMKC